MRHGRHIPYRGEVRPKLYGHPSPQKPGEKNVTFIFWFLFILVGLVILYSALTLAAQGKFDGVFGFVIYLMFAAIAFFAMMDLKKIKMITPELDDDHEPGDKDGPSLAEDYFEQIEWMHTHRKGRHASRWDAPEPQRRYRIVKAKGGKLTERQNFFPLAALLGIGILAVIASVFKLSSLITTGIVIVSGLIFLFAYLMRD